MRHFLLSACLAALCVACATPSSAEEAPDCGVLCRITGYLSSDHMTANPSVVAAPGAPSKPRKIHAAKVHKAPATAQAAATTPKSLPNARIAQAGAKATEGKPEAAKLVAPAEPAASKPKAPKAATARAAGPVRPKVAAAAPLPVAKPSAPSSPAPRSPAPRPAHAVPASVEAVTTPQPAPVRLARARPPKTATAALSPATRRLKGTAAPVQTAALALIPGSAPAMPAGFQPFKASVPH